MKARRNLLAAAFALTSLLGLAACADSRSPAFLKVGETYFLDFTADWPAGLATEFTIIKAGGGDWFLVEYAMPDQRTERRWINFATVRSVRERKK
jgi:hypothetical protein